METYVINRTTGVEYPTIFPTMEDGCDQASPLKAIATTTTAAKPKEETGIYYPVSG